MANRAPTPPRDQYDDHDDDDVFVPSRRGPGWTSIHTYPCKLQTQWIMAGFFINQTSPFSRIHARHMPILQSMGLLIPSPLPADPLQQQWVQLKLTFPDLDRTIAVHALILHKDYLLEGNPVPFVYVGVDDIWANKLSLRGSRLSFPALELVGGCTMSLDFSQ